MVCFPTLRDSLRSRAVNHKGRKERKASTAIQASLRDADLNSFARESLLELGFLPPSIFLMDWLMDWLTDSHEH